MRILAVDELADLDPRLAADFATQHRDDAADLRLGEILIIAEQLDDTITVGADLGFGAIGPETEIHMGANAAVEHLGKGRHPVFGEARDMHAHRMHRGHAQQAMNAAEQRNEPPRAQHDEEAQRKHKDEGAQHHQLIHAGVHAKEADGAKAELHQRQHQHGILDTEPRPQEKVVQVVAVGMEGGTAHPHPAQHHAQGVDERHRKQPERGDRRECPDACIGLGEIGEQPRKQKTELHAAVVAHEAPGATPAQVAQVEQQKTRHTACDDDDQGEVGRITGQIDGKGNQAKADDGERPRKPVDAVDHVEGVDGTDGGQQGDRQGEIPQAENVARDQTPQIGDLDPAQHHHHDAETSLDGKTDLVVELQDVVRKTGCKQDDQPCHQHVDAIAKRREELADHIGSSEIGNEDADATNKGRDGIVSLVPPRLIDNPEAVGRLDAVVDRHSRHKQTQQEQRHR